MERIAVPYRDTGRFSGLVTAYLEGDAKLRKFHQWTGDLDGLRQASQARAFQPASRIALGDALARQYAGMHLQAPVLRNLELLKRPGTQTITTGHQLCLFTGPLYVVFKILNTIRLARQFSTSDPGMVPVFWMATEDHDRPEIDHAYLNGTKVEWPGQAGGAVGRMTMDGIGRVLDQVDSLLGLGSHADVIRDLLRRCYRPDHDLARATRLFVDALFGRYGVVVLDGDDPGLKREFVPVMREELLNNVAERSVRYADQRLGEHWKTQAHVRPINLFYLRPGHRSRIERVGEKYQVLEGGPSFSLDELLRELDRHPEHFSPNVLMRPLYQETILPNVAYIGGGGELAYWFQTKWLFQAVRVPMPVLLLRTSAAFMPEKDAQRMLAWGFDAKDVFLPLEVLRSRLAKGSAAFPTSMDREIQETRAFYASLAERSVKADPTLQGAVAAMEKRALHHLDAFGNKLVRAAKRQQAEPLEQLARVHGRFFPGGGLQERRENFLVWYAREGPGFFDRLLTALDPLDPHFSILPG